ncbi:MAG: hypothetical protein GEU98_17620 [Pseudonocardiaceae bacterium]|nr:hypothetical protein [Pseudonocardiaceae bacterium]
MSAPQPAEPRPIVVHIGNEELIIRRRYEVASILNDMLIAIWFAVGSVFFLFEDLLVVGTWLFIVGSVQLAIRPAIRLRRRVHLRRFNPSGPTEAARDF